MSLMRTISWPGAKYRALDSLLRWCPVTPFGAMCEPFFGSGALTLALAGQIEGPVFIAEANSALRNWWHWALADVDALLARSAEFRTAWASVGLNRTEFDAMRQTWNDMAREEPAAMDTAALLWCLIYASTNNLARFNQQGGYNQTWGQGRIIPDPEEVVTAETRRRIRAIAPRTTMFDDFADALLAFLDFLDDGGTGVCYLDPPYVLEAGMYDAHAWGTGQLARLADFIEDLEARAAWWLYTDYMAKGEAVHPYAHALRRFRQVALRTTRDARPSGTARPSSEVLTVGTVVEARTQRLFEEVAG